MRFGWACLVASMACGRVGFEPLGERSGVDAPGTTGDPAVMRVMPVGVGNPYPTWNGESFGVVTSFVGSSYQAFSVTGEPLTSATQLGGGLGISYVLQAIEMTAGLGVLWMPETGGVTLSFVDRSGAVTSDVMVASSTNARIARSLDRDELCLVWADSDAVGPQRSVRAARLTPAGVKIGADLIVRTSTDRYRRVDVGCRGDALYVLYATEVGGWYYYYLHTFVGTTTQVQDTPVVSTAAHLWLHDVILLGENLNAPVFTHGTPGVNLQVDSFDPGTPGPIAGPPIDCAAQSAVARWDGRDVAIVAACYDTAKAADTLYVMAVTPLGALTRLPIAVQTAQTYGGGPTGYAVSPTGHIAVGFTEWDANIEANQGFVGFLAPSDMTRSP